MTAAEADELLTISELAALAGVKTATANQWGRRGKLPAPWAHTPAGRLWRREDVEEWWAAMKAKQLAAATDAVREQWRKYDEAVARGLTGAPLVRIDQKLRRLELEREELSD